MQQKVLCRMYDGAVKQTNLQTKQGGDWTSDKVSRE